jgi:Reverse transcriptase (RNA-dependent DNA polymerase)
MTLVFKIIYKLLTGKFDVETAFLYSELVESIWMQLPEGYVDYLKEVHNKIIDPSLYCLKLLKAIYGLIQAARQWWKKIKTAMAKLIY